MDESDLRAWIRRYDRDADGQLDYADLIVALAPNCNYVRKAQLAPQAEPALDGLTGNNYGTLDAGSARLLGKADSI